MTRRARRRAPARGGQGGWEPRPRIREREEHVDRLAAEGRSQVEIADRLGLSQPGVSKILRRLDARWWREHQDRGARHTVEQVRKLDHVYREALDAWERSKAPHVRRRQRKADATTATAGGLAEIVTDESHGDPRYLETARRVLADRAKLLGTPAAGPVPAPGSDRPVVFTINLGED